MSSNSNNLIPDYSSLFKVSVPKFDMSSINQTMQIINKQNRDRLNSINRDILKSMKINTDLLTNQNQIFKSSIQPLLDQMHLINKELLSSLNSSALMVAKNSLDSLRTISEYSPEIIENINKPLFVDLVDEVYNVSDSEDFTSDLSSIKSHLQESANNQVSIKDWIETICAILGILMTIFTLLDNSSEKAQINAQNQIIESQSEQLKRLESIDNSLQKLIQAND